MSHIKLYEEYFHSLNESTGLDAGFFLASDNNWYMYIEEWNDYVTKEFYIEEPIVGSAPLRIVVSLTDPEYFCNKSWTASYNFNTQSWISFHSYTPNFYIGENNFFYSGLNGCCEDFDFIAGEIVPDPITTTTTTSIIPTTSTTSTTVAPYDCGLRGNVVFTYCALDGNGVVTVGPLPKPCERPEKLSQVDFAIGYTITSINLVVDSTISQVDACNAITYLNTFPPNTVLLPADVGFIGD